MCDAVAQGADVTGGGEHGGPFAAAVRECLVQGLAPQGGVVVDVLLERAVTEGAAFVEQVDPVAEGGLRHHLPGRDGSRCLARRSPGAGIIGHVDVAPRAAEPVDRAVVEQFFLRVPGGPVRGGQLLGHRVAQDDLRQGDDLGEGGRDADVPQIQLHRSGRRRRGGEVGRQAGAGDQRLQKPEHSGTPMSWSAASRIRTASPRTSTRAWRRLQGQVGRRPRAHRHHADLAHLRRADPPASGGWCDRGGAASDRCGGHHRVVFHGMGHQRRWPACGFYARPVNRFPVLARSNFGPAINHIRRAAAQRSGGGPLPNPHHEYEAEDDHALAAPAHRAPTARPSVRWLACAETA